MTISRREWKYRVWRARFPWTNQQIIDALNAHAAEVPTEFHRRQTHNTVAFIERTGHLTRGMMMFVLPLMVRTCQLCGRRAFYRYGVFGRCRAHRDIATAGMIAMWRRRKLVDAEWDADIQQWDKWTKTHEQMKAIDPKRAHRSKERRS